MNNLKAIISILSRKDQQHFVHYLERKNKRADNKNIQLFKLLAKNDLDSKAVCLKLYDTTKSDAYHALRKRLYQSLIDFIANQNLEEEKAIDMQIIKYVLASRTFLYHKQYDVAYKILDRAENLAQENYLFPLLNEIYHTKIQYAYAKPSIDIHLLIEKFKINQKHYYLEDELNIVYAKIRQVITNATLNKEFINFQLLVSETLKEFDIDIKASMSFKSLYQLMKIVSISVFATNDNLKIEPFLLNTYKVLLTHKNKEKQLYYHLQVVFIIAYTLFKNKKFKASLSYLEVMANLLKLKQHKYYNTFKPKYNLVLALNFNFINKQKKALQVLEPFLSSKHTDIESLLDIYLSLIMIYFQQGNYKKAHQVFSKFYHTDTWYIKRVGKEWVIKKNLMEILLHIELENIDLVESRLLSFKRHYFKFLLEIKQQRVITYLNLVNEYYKNPENAHSQKFRNKVENSFEWVGGAREDIFVMGFYAWLKSKMEQKTLYKATLELVDLSKSKTIH